MSLEKIARQYKIKEASDIRRYLDLEGEPDKQAQLMGDRFQLDLAANKYRAELNKSNPTSRYSEKDDDDGDDDDENDDDTDDDSKTKKTVEHYKKKIKTLREKIAEEKREAAGQQTSYSEYVLEEFDHARDDQITGMKSFLAESREDGPELYDDAVDCFPSLPVDLTQKEHRAAILPALDKIQSGGARSVAKSFWGKIVGNQKEPIEVFKRKVTETNKTLGPQIEVLEDYKVAPEGEEEIRDDKGNIVKVAKKSRAQIDQMELERRQKENSDAQKAEEVANEVARMLKAEAQGGDLQKAHEYAYLKAINEFRAGKYSFEEDEDDETKDVEKKTDVGKSLKDVSDDDDDDDETKDVEKKTDVGKSLKDESDDDDDDDDEEEDEESEEQTEEDEKYSKLYKKAKATVLKKPKEEKKEEEIDEKKAIEMLEKLEKELAELEEQKAEVAKKTQANTPTRQKADALDDEDEDENKELIEQIEKKKEEMKQFQDVLQKHCKKLRKESKRNNDKDDETARYEREDEYLSEYIKKEKKQGKTKEDVQLDLFRKKYRIAIEAAAKELFSAIPRSMGIEPNNYAELGSAAMPPQKQAQMMFAAELVKEKIPKFEDKTDELLADHGENDVPSAAPDKEEEIAIAIIEENEAREERINELEIKKKNLEKELMAIAVIEKIIPPTVTGYAEFDENFKTHKGRYRNLRVYLRVLYHLIKNSKNEGADEIRDRLKKMANRGDILNNIPEEISPSKRAQLKVYERIMEETFEEALELAAQAADLFESNEDIRKLLIMLSNSKKNFEQSLPDNTFNEGDLFTNVTGKKRANLLADVGYVW